MSTSIEVGILALGSLAGWLLPRILIACVCLTTAADIDALIIADDPAKAYLFAFLHWVA